MEAVAVASGKGGVGKSLVSSSLVQALAASGKRVGVIDADFSNPNLGRLLQIHGELEVDQNKRLVPVKKGKVQFFSLEQVVKDRGVAMTGEQYGEIVQDAVMSGVWDADYMVVDLPAVISNEFRSVLAAFENDYLGSIVVAQPAHLATTERVVKLHQINGVPIVGLVENMVGFTCEHGTTYDLFGKSGIDTLASTYGLPVLAKIPISMEIEKAVAAGKPVSIPDKSVAEAIEAAVLAAKPQKLGFMQELRQKAQTWTRELLFKVLVQAVLIINQAVDIGDLQKRHNFPGGITFGLLITGEDLNDVKERLNFRIDSGKLLVVQDPKQVEYWITVKGVALAWAILGRKKFPDGKTVPYDILDAFSNGDATVYGTGSLARGVSFYNDIWTQARAELAPKLEPLLARVA